VRTVDGAGAKDTLWCAADVTDRAQVLAMVDAVHDRFGAIDVLVNNVGGSVDVDPFVKSDPVTWERDIALTIVSTLNCSHVVLPGMIERSHGRIINLGSTSGIVGDPNMAV
jgi:2-hydroxycyclohexanecarboxyl-CoA dehydrogenase